MINYFSTLSAEVHAENAHWWRNPANGKRIDRNKNETLFLINSEISEAGEGLRKDRMDDHLPHRRQGEVELADVMIRLFDYIGAWSYDIDRCLFRTFPSLHPSRNNITDLLPYFRNRFFTVSGNVAEQLLHMQRTVCRIADLEDAGAPARDIESAITWLIMLVCDFSAIQDYDLWGAIQEKRAYNKQRADHKDAARLAAGGKKW